jgi:hypothetical protein
MDTGIPDFAVLNPGYTRYFITYCGCPEPAGRVAAPSVGTSPTATGAAGRGLDGREPTVAPDARPWAGRRGGTGVAAGRGLPSPDGACPFGEDLGADGSGTMMFTGGIV